MLLTAKKREKAKKPGFTIEVRKGPAGSTRLGIRRRK